MQQKNVKKRLIWATCLLLGILVLSIWAQPKFTANAAGEYSVDYTQHDWGCGATVNVIITNNGSSAIEGWRLQWNFNGNQQITNLWNGTFTQSGNYITVNNQTYNSIIAANGGRVTFGFNISYSGTNAIPGNFTLNGQVSPTALPSASSTPVTTPPVTTPPVTTATPVPTPNSGYMYNNLVWSDEFTGSNLNRSNWNYQIGNGCNPGTGTFDGWGNGEWEWYRESNVAVTDGNLVIKGEYQSTPYQFGNRKWYQFSGRITTKGLQSWKYARIEARIKLPTVYGTWPAFWMMGNNCDTTVNGAAGGYDVLPTNWSSCGEVDIMEHVNSDSKFCSNLFWDTRNGLYPWANGSNANNPTWTSGVDVSQYHVYAMEWNSTTLKYYLDGKVIKTQNISAANQEEFHNQNWFIILNMAISGSLTGSAQPNQNDFPCKMYVDYVRVYQ